MDTIAAPIWKLARTIGERAGVPIPNGTAGTAIPAWNRFCMAVDEQLTIKESTTLPTLLEGYADLLERCATVAEVGSAMQLARKFYRRWLTEHPDERPPRTRRCEHPPKKRRRLCPDETASPTESTRPVVCYRPYTREHDQILVVSPVDEQTAAAFRKESEAVVRSLKLGLMRTLLSEEKRRWLEQQERGQLSIRNLYRLTIDQDNHRVFRQRELTIGRQTCVTLLLDLSASMAGERLRLARQAVLAITEALETLRVPCEVLGYGTGQQFSIKEAHRITRYSLSKLRRLYSRFANLVIKVIKQYGEPCRSSTPRLANVTCGGMTPLGEALLLAAQRIQQRRERRKILLVCTDGKPDCEAGHQRAIHYARKVVRQLIGEGLEIVGVSILDKSLSRIISNTIIVNKLEELPDLLVRQLGRTIKQVNHEE
ncbi:MAG: hypothetical protein HJJLKODD_02995 [Phycisphaerae bacterium]|nr:hypothetical protein [Phycisphaerae bacterium]